MRNGVSPEPLLEVRRLTAGFDAGPVLFGIDLEVAPSELVALDAANRAYVLENGRVALSGKAADVKEDPGVRRAYLGL